MEILYGLAGLLFCLYFLGYILMGFLQPIAAICRLLSEKRLDSSYAIGLKKYLLSVTGYFIILFFMIQIEPFYDILYLFQFYLLVAPWSLAIWYIRHIRTWKKKRKNIRAYDKLQLLNAPHEDRLLLESYPKKTIKIKNSIGLRNKDFVNIRTAKIRKLPSLIMNS